MQLVNGNRKVDETQNPFWVMLIGLAIGAQVVDGAWAALVLMPMQLDSDLGHAYELLRESGARDPVAGTLIVTAIMLLLTLVGFAFGARFVERRFAGSGASAVLARCSTVFLAICVSGVASSVPGQLMSFPLADMVELTPVKESAYATWLSVFLVVQLGSFALAAVSGFAAVLARRWARSSQASGDGPPLDGM